jgi:predicted RNase H-like HicB family nuclease
MKLSYPVIFYPDESGAYAAVVPDLAGCATGGNSLPEAIDMAVDAASGWVLDELEDGKKAPPASPVSSIKPDPEIGEGGFVSVIALDMDAYAAKYGKKAVHKNLSIPAWLNTWAVKANINFSHVLEEALEKSYKAAAL